MYNLATMTSTSPDKFWHSPTLAELAAEQGVGPVQRSERVIGQGADLWDSDVHFDRFLAAVHQARHVVTA